MKNNWLDDIEKAQDGWMEAYKAEHPSVRSIRNDTMNRKMNPVKKEDTSTKKDNTKTSKVDTRQESADAWNKRALKESQAEAIRQTIDQNMQEAYHHPLMQPGMFTPEGAAIMSMQQGAEAIKNTIEGNYGHAALNAGFAALPFVGEIPGVFKKAISKIKTPKNFELPAPESTINLDINDASRFSLDRSPRTKNNTYKERIEDGKFTISKRGGTKENPRIINVKTPTGDIQAVRNPDGSFMFHNKVSSKIDAGKAMLKLNEHLPSNPQIFESSSMSPDSYTNLLKIGKSKDWVAKHEGFVPMNDAHENVNFLDDLMKPKNRGANAAFPSESNALEAQGRMREYLQKQGYSENPNILERHGEWQMELPNYRLQRNYENGGQLEELINSGSKYNSAWRGSAQNGKKLNPNDFYETPQSVVDTLGLTELMKNKYPVDKSGYAAIPRTSLMGGGDRFLQVNQKLQSPSTQDKEYIEGRNSYAAWYNDPYTKKTFQKNTGYDPSILEGLTTYGLNTPAHPASESESQVLTREGADAQFYDNVNQIVYKKGAGKGVIEHEIGHATGVDSLLGPELMKSLGGNPFQQKQNKTTGKGFMKEDISNIKQYLSKPEEAYGNFHNLRVNLGLKPGEKVDKAKLQKLIKEKKQEKNNFYLMYDDDNIVKAINTIASTDNRDESNYAEYGTVIQDDMGQWSHPGEITKINSNNITMKGVPFDVLGVSNTGDRKLMKPGKNYKFKGESVTEYPRIAKNGSSLKELDQLLNFTNYNKPQKGGWLDQY